MTEAVTAMKRRMKHSKQWLLSDDGSGDSNEATNEAQQTMASVCRTAQPKRGPRVSPLPPPSPSYNTHPPTHHQLLLHILPRRQALPLTQRRRAVQPRGRIPLLLGGPLHLCRQLLHQAAARRAALRLHQLPPLPCRQLACSARGWSGVEWGRWV